MQTYHSALGCDVETICGKSIMVTWSWSSSIRLNSLKSPWIRPWLASLTMSSMSSLYRPDGSCSSCTWHLQNRHTKDMRRKQWLLFFQEQRNHLVQRKSIDELHHHSMPVIVHRFGNREASVIKRLESKKIWIQLFVFLLIQRTILNQSATFM